MLPKKRTQGHESGSGPGGCEVRVIGGGRSAPPDGASRNLEMGLRIGVGEARERVKTKPTGNSVHRLEAKDEAEPMQARPMSDVGPALPGAAGSRRKPRRGLAHWSGWMAAATVLVAVVVVGGMTLAGKDPKTDRDGDAGYVFEPVTTLDRDQQYFLEHAGDLIAEAEDVLERYAGAATVEDVLPFVRDGERMKLDWEASEGIGELQIADLQAGSPAAGGVVRALVRPSTFHTADFPESDFRSYQLTDAGGDHFIWGFAPRGSAVVVALEAEFNEASVLLDKITEMRATVRLAGSGGGGGKCREITEMLHKGWVTP